MPGDMNRFTGRDNARRVADELALQIHLAGMDARDRWGTWQLQLARTERTLALSGQRAGDAVKHQLAEIRAALEHLRDDMYTRAHRDYLAGW